MPLSLSHLTTGQLSALLDQQLSASEQSRCQLHLTTCRSCQQQLAELQQTVLLVQSLPRAALPRSFLLSSDLVEAKAAASSTVVWERARQSRSVAMAGSRRSALRSVSTLVATLGLFFLLSGTLGQALSLPFVQQHSTSVATERGSLHAFPKAVHSSSVNVEPDPQKFPSDTGNASAPQAPPDPTMLRSSADAYKPTLLHRTPQSPAPPVHPSVLQIMLGLGLFLFIIGIIGMIYFFK